MSILAVTLQLCYYIIKKPLNTMLYLVFFTLPYWLILSDQNGLSVFKKPSLFPSLQLKSIWSQTPNSNYTLHTNIPIKHKTTKTLISFSFARTAVFRAFPRPYRAKLSAAPPVGSTEPSEWGRRNPRRGRLERNGCCCGAEHFSGRRFSNPVHKIRAIILLTYLCEEKPT